MFGDQCGPVNQVRSADPRNLREEHSTKIGQGDMPSYRPAGVRARIERTIEDGERSMQRVHAAYRAKQIIDQHPEFAELLDLLQEF